MRIALRVVHRTDQTYATEGADELPGEVMAMRSIKLMPEPCLGPWAGLDHMAQTHPVPSASTFF